LSGRKIGCFRRVNGCGRQTQAQEQGDRAHDTSGFYRPEL
jgi:hypothetical protein